MPEHAFGLDLFLKQLTSRSELEADEREAILAVRGDVAKFPTNRDFVAQVQRVSYSCLVVEGFVGGFVQTPQGHRQMTALHVAGDMPDLHSVVVPEANTALQALTATTILRIPHPQLSKIASAFPAIAQAFWRECTISAAIATSWIANVGRRDARTRLAHLLCETAARLDRVGVGDWQEFPLPLTQQHLADALGLTSVHVNRMLRDLKHEGLILVANRRVTVLDRIALERAADFDPNYLCLGTPPARMAA